MSSFSRQSPRGRPVGKEPPPTLWPLPSDTQRMARAHEKDCSNPGLWLDKFAAYTRRGPIWEMGMQAKKREDVRWGVPGYREGLKQYTARWQKILDANGATSFVAEPQWRMVVGLGGASVRETGLTLHRLYGFPVIPGSALKGLTSSWAEIEHPHDSDRAHIFGTQEESGAVVFFDTIPLAPPRMKLDVMNPHYGEYYMDKTGRTPPADWLSPVPVYFLTVEAGSQFLFALGPRRRNHPEDQACVSKAMAWLKEALREMGVGAKTTAGYGYMQVG